MSLFDVCIHSHTVADRCLGHSMHQLISCGSSHPVSHSSTTPLVGDGVASLLSTLRRRSQDFRCWLWLIHSLFPLSLFHNHHHFRLIQFIGFRGCQYFILICSWYLLSLWRSLGVTNALFHYHLLLTQLIGPSSCLYSLIITTSDLFSYSTQLVLIIPVFITTSSLFS